MTKGLSLRFKLILFFLLIATLIAGVGFYQIRSIRHLNDSFLQLIDNDFQRLESLHDIKLYTTQMREATFEYQQGVFEGEPASPASEKQKIRALDDRVNTAETTYRSLVRESHVATTVNIDAIAASTRDITAKSLTVIDNTTSGDQSGPEAQEDALSNAQDKLTTLIDAALINEQNAIGRADLEVDNTVTRLLDATVALAFATIGMAVLLGFVVSSWISRSISVLRVGAGRIANGDFAHPIPVKSTDEIGQLARVFNEMSERLREAYRRQAVGQQRDEAMLQSLGEGLIVVDEKAEIVLINEAALEFINLPNQAAAIGRPLLDVYQLYDVNDKEKKPLQHDQRPSYIALHTGASVNEVYAYYKADGKKYLMSITANPVVLNDSIIGAITVMRDVTKEKEVDRMKTEFISLASHQLRTPLSAIKWYSEMLVAGDAGQLQADQLDFAKNIADSTERMIALVNALLNISRIESGRIMVDPKPTDLKELVSGIVTDLKAKTEEKTQTLLISVHDELPKINLDPRLIGQVYLNLLTNAIKYTPKGGEIAVFISRKDDYIISQVTDNGYGIPKEQQGRVFEKFFRAANAVKIETDGTGLGLYLIKAVIESSGGKIWFQSEEGKGTTFWFSIPLSGMKAKEGEVTLDV
ncbi:MAG TPA: ATP-binding protein [Bacillota bacterium]|nr:ATP-binding protein [Bacillota bacterium]